MVRVMLVERFPAVFSQPRPLKIGIYEHLRTALGDQLSSTHLHHFLYFWTHTPTYRAALARADRRIDLAGQDAGPAAPEREEDTRSLSEYSLDDRLKA